VRPLIEHGPAAEIVGAIPEFEVAAIANVDWYGAEAGAPVKVTVCEALSEATVSVTVAAAR
jgi:hypothetical protein